MVIVKTINENGEEVTKDMLEELFDPDDYRQIIHEHAARVQEHSRLALAWRKRLYERYGVEMPELDNL